MNYVIQVNADLFAVVTFEVAPLPDNDYDILVSSMSFVDSEDNEVFIADYEAADQKELLDAANEAVDAYIDANHAMLHKMSAKASLSSTPKGWLH